MPEILAPQMLEILTQEMPETNLTAEPMGARRFEKMERARTSTWAGGWTRRIFLPMVVSSTSCTRRSTFWRFIPMEQFDAAGPIALATALRETLLRHWSTPTSTWRASGTMAGWYVSALTELNTPDAQECCAFTSWNGKSLYFMRSPIDESVRPKYWVAKRAGARFAAPVPTDLPVENGNIALDETETTLYFDANFEDPNAGAGKEIWSTTRTASGWAPVVRLPNQVNDPSKFSQTPWLSRDGERIYFHRFLASGAGSDIWVTSKENGFTEVTALPIVGPPFVPALNDRLIGEPSLNEDETLMYAVVYNAQGIPEIWSGRMSSTGVWNMKSVDVK